MKRCREQKKNMHMIFINLEKVYMYDTLINYMHNNIVISVRISDGDTNDFSINI
jgi:hypothetical protein